MMKREDVKPGQLVSVWGRFDHEEKPEVLAVKANGVWIMRTEKQNFGPVKITKERVPFHAIELV